MTQEEENNKIKEYKKHIGYGYRISPKCMDCEYIGGYHKQGSNDIQYVCNLNKELRFDISGTNSCDWFDKRRTE